jgi:prepilin-type N-terminal cleavage/methylation domain-containing protein
MSIMLANRKQLYRASRAAAAGFTLLEVVIALAIFSIGFLAVMSMQLEAMQGTRSSRSYMEAGTLAQDRVEQLLALDISDARLVGGTNGVDNTTPGYSVTWSVVDNGETPNNSRTITVTATQADGYRATLTVVKGGRS